MATGYTCSVGDGTMTKCSDFIKACARAFGATIAQREESLSAPLKTEYAPDSYHEKQLEHAKKELEALQKMTLAEAEALAKKDYEAECARHKKANEEEKATLDRYMTMGKKVKAWRAPTAEHQDLKNFMLEQLQISINHDCRGSQYRMPPRLLAPEEYLDCALARAKRNVEYHEKGWLEEQERTGKRNAWLKALVDSLPED